MSEEKIGAYGEPVEPEDPNDPYWVPPEERLENDDDPDASSLKPGEDGVDTGDDLDGWSPGDPV